MSAQEQREAAIAELAAIITPRRAEPGTHREETAMGYDDKEDAVEHVGIHSTIRVENPGPEPAPFDPHADMGDWSADEAQVEDWANLGAGRFEGAVGRLSLTALRVGISQAQRVAAEHERRRVNAHRLVQALREAAHDAAEHGSDDEKALARHPER